MAKRHAFNGIHTILMSAAIMLAVVGNATTIVDLEDGSTVAAATFNGYNGHTGGTSTSASVANYALRFGKDVTVKLDPAYAVDGVFTLYANIYATNGSFTVDAAGIDAIHWVGGVQTSGKVTVKGAKEIRFGELLAISWPNGKTNFSYFNTDVEFENGEATGLVFTNAVTCAKLPTSCDYSIAAGMRLAVDAYGLLGSGAATFTLADYDITLIETKGINAGEIVVPSGRTLEIRQCSRTTFNVTGGRWAWGGQANNHVTNDLTFAAGSVFYVDGAQPNLYFDGAVSGETAFTVNIGNAPGTIHFRKSVSLAGTVAISGNTAFNLSGSGPFSFGTVTSAVQHDITGLEGCVLSISELSADSVIGVGAGIDLRIGSSVGAGARINLLGAGPWSVSGPASGIPADISGTLEPETVNGAISFGGLLALGNLGSTFSSVTLLDGAVLTGTTFDSGVKISGAGRIVHEGSSWKEKVALWVDSTDTNSFVYVGDECNDWTTPSKTGYSNRTLISQWKDCRQDHDVYRFRNTRYKTTEALSNRSANVYPLDENTADFRLNGYHTVSMWHNANSSSRRINIVKSENVNAQSPITAAYAIMVFGAQSGGGAALLGTADGYFGRLYGADKSNGGGGASNPISSNNVFEVHLNGGAAMSATEVGFSNGWQIVSMDAKSQKVYGIGAQLLGTGNEGSSTATEAGFQRYAEVMLFTEAPTERERKVAEEYLAVKWGLPCAHNDARLAVSLTLGISGETASALVEYPADDIPRAFTVNLDFGGGIVRGARYPLLKCSTGDTYALGTVTGARRASEVALEYDSETGTLYAAITATGFRMIVR